MLNLNRLRFIRMIMLSLALMASGMAHALELVFFSRPGCVYCLKWEKDIGPIYQRSAEAKRAPLRQWNLNDGAPPYTLKEPVRYTPTFVLVERGVEIGRITGYISDDMFWGLLGKMLKDTPAETK
jgi:thioredoxin-related protein